MKKNICILIPCALSFAFSLFAEQNDYQFGLRHPDITVENEKLTLRPDHAAAYDVTTSKDAKTVTIESNGTNYKTSDPNIEAGPGFSAVQATSNAQGKLNRISQISPIDISKGQFFTTTTSFSNGKMINRTICNGSAKGKADCFTIDSDVCSSLHDGVLERTPKTVNDLKEANKCIDRLSSILNSIEDNLHDNTGVAKANMDSLNKFAKGIKWAKAKFEFQGLSNSPSIIMNLRDQVRIAEQTLSACELLRGQKAKSASPGPDSSDAKIRK